MTKRKVSEIRPWLVAWHMLRAALVRSGISKTYHMSKAGYHLMKMLRDSTRDREGLTEAEYRILVALAKMREGTAAEIAEATGLSRSTVYSKMRLLERAGVVRVVSQRPKVFSLAERYVEALRELDDEG